jgi:hypothetical protein
LSAAFQPKKKVQRPHPYLRALQFRSSCLLHLFSWVVLTSFHIGLIPFVQLALGISVLYCLNGISIFIDPLPPWFTAGVVSASA